MQENLKIWAITDSTESITQNLQLALRLTAQENITKVYKDDQNYAFSSNVNAAEPVLDLNYEKQADGSAAPVSTAVDDSIGRSDFPDLCVGVGFNVTETMVNIKRKSNGTTKLAIILDPLKHYEEFDFIILPSYEPYKIEGGNVIRSTGLINFVNESYLALIKDEYENHPKYEYLRQLNLKPPFLSVVIGGNHTGGTISKNDSLKLAEKINQLIAQKGGTALITTSRRTEVHVPDILNRELKVPYFLYDYKRREYENPYGVFLALADEFIVTGESVRMMSECCSTGKKVRIYRPEKYGFQYEPLVNELIEKRHAVEFDNSDDFIPEKLDEAGRVAELIRSKS